jgi:AcrR family transcriptional regulator
MLADPAAGNQAARERAPLDDALVAAARRALARHGAARATLERIAEEAGLSRVTLYRRGLTREAVLAALAERAVDDYRRALWPALTARGHAAERLRRALGALCQLAEDNLELLLALAPRGDALVHARARNAEEGVLSRRAFIEPLERLLRDGAADGTLRETDARETATVLLNLVGWTYVHLRAGHRWSARRARATTLDLALRGVTSPGSETSEASG